MTWAIAGAYRWGLALVIGKKRKRGKSLEVS